MTEEQAANITNEPGIIVYGRGAADGTKIRFESPGQVPNYLFADLDTSRDAFDNIWGIHSTTRGEREGRETLGGRKLLRAADLGRIDGIARQIERALDDIAEHWTQLIKTQYTVEKAFRILGNEGEVFIEAFKGNDIKNRKHVKLSVKPGSTLPRDEITIHQEGIQLWQLGAIGPKTLYKMLQLPNKEEAMEDLIEWQSGAALQAGTEGAPGAPGGGTPLNEGAGTPAVAQSQ
jgi:hypothetical protein